MTRQLALDQSELQDATNVLLVSPEVGQSVETLFSDLLLSLETPPDHLVGVTTSKSPWDFHEQWQGAFPRGTTSYSFVSTNGVARSVAADSGGGGFAATDVDVTRVEDVTPLTTFGTTVADAIPAGGEAAVCLHSLTDLLEYVDTETAFRFLHVLLSRVRVKDARGIYHIDGQVHDEETITHLSTLFDLVVEFDSHGPGPGPDATRDGPL